MATNLIIYWLATSFAVYRVSRMLTEERGPWDLFLNFQIWSHDRWGKDSWQFHGFTCPLCEGFWISLLASLLVFGWDFWIWWLPISGLQAWLQKQERE